VKADRRLGEAQRRGQLAHAHLAALVRADQGHQPEPDRVRQGLEHLRQPGSRALADRLTDQRRGAGFGNGLQLGCGNELQRPLVSLHRHDFIWTVIYPGWQTDATCIDTYQWEVVDEGWTCVADVLR
jgi:hypothetical protein